MIYQPSAMKWMLLIMGSLIATLGLLKVTTHNKTMMIEWSLMILGSAQINMPLILDTISISVVLIVLFITLNVMMFSHIYMVDISQSRFYVMLMLFVASMIMFTMIPNIMAMLLGWDGLGITSFLLVAYYQTPTAAGSSMVTMFTNRIGDVLLIMSMLMFSSLGHWTINTMWSLPTPVIIILTGLAASTKSAHHPFHLWLPEAMAAPTPVSALVHSSTLVTAGIILILRLYPSFSAHPTFMWMIWAMGLFTATLAGITATFIHDTKKMVAYSTMSQLGVMSLALGLGAPHLTHMHLITHATFKALMFISVGLGILHNKHKQSLTSNNSKTKMYLTSTSMKIATMSLMAFPFTAGFMSKDLILESMFTHSSGIFTITMIIPMALTTTYGLRLLRLATTNNSPSPSGTPPTINTMTNSLYSLTPLMIMAASALVSGSYLIYLMTTPQSSMYTLITSTTSIYLMPFIGMLLLQSKIYHMKMNSYIYLGSGLWPLMTHQVQTSFSVAIQTYKYMDKGTINMVIYATIKLMTKLSQSLASHFITSTMAFFIMMMLVPIFAILLL